LVLQARSRLQIETAIGYNIGAIFEGSWTSNASTTVNTDTKWKGAADDANGKWLHITEADQTESGEIVRVTDDNGSGQLTHDALTGTPSSTETYILWDEEYRPDAIYSYIDQAVIEATERFYDPVEDITLFADGKTNRFDVPSGISMVQKLMYRSKVTQKQIHDASSAWNSGSGVTATPDTKIKKQGVASNKMVVSGGVGAGAVISFKDITAIDLSPYTHIEWWARCSKTTTAADLKLLLDDTAACLSPLELLDFPALTVDTWTFIRVALDKADGDKAIISVGIEDDVDIGAETVWIDDVRAVNNDEQTWVPLPNRLWKVNRNAREIVLTNSGRAVVGYNLLKIVGGDKPALLSSDSSTNEVPDRYIIARATALALSAAPPTEENRNLAGYWDRQANRAFRSLPMLTNIRVVE
jgi:hypothetical protein